MIEQVNLSQHRTGKCSQCEMVFKEDDVIAVDFANDYAKFCWVCWANCSRCGELTYGHTEVIANGFTEAKRFNLFCTNCNDEYLLYLKPPCPAA